MDVSIVANAGNATRFAPANNKIQHKMIFTVIGSASGGSGVGHRRGAMRTEGEEGQRLAAAARRLWDRIYSRMRRCGERADRSRAFPAHRGGAADALHDTNTRGGREHLRPQCDAIRVERKDWNQARPIECLSIHYTDRVSPIKPSRAHPQTYSVALWIARALLIIFTGIYRRRTFRMLCFCPV